MGSRKTSLIWKVSAEDLRQAVAESNTVLEVLERIGYSKHAPGGHRWRMFRARCEQEGIDLSGLSERRRRKVSDQLAKMALDQADRTRVPLSEMLVENSLSCSTSHLKKRLISEGVLQDRCAVCGCGPTWLGKQLVMVLDHINGVHTDNRVENLRLLCPNCNSQTDTFCGRSARLTKKEQPPVLCSCCGKKIGGNGRTGLCRSCINRSEDRSASRKVVRPSMNDLSDMLSSMSWSAVARQYGVSDNAVRKWARSYGLL